jgi:hypothetical protein
MPPLPQDVPSVASLQAVVLTPGWHVRHAFAESTAPDAYTVPPMKQPAPHVPALQISPAPQPVPVATFVHIDVLVPGWQLWHALPGFVVPDK